MSSGLYYAVSGFKSQEKAMEILSNNLANVSTMGFKEDKASFKGVYPGITTPMTIETPDDQRQLMLARKMNMGYPGISDIQVDFSNGQMQYTGNEQDVAIQGKGFFVVDTPQGELYTRQGNFTLNEKNEMVNFDGYHLKGIKQEEGEPIVIQGTEIAVDEDGAVSFFVDNGGIFNEKGTQVDTLKIVDFKDYAQLHKVGDNYYKHTGSAENEVKAEECEVMQSHTELSNVSVVKEMIRMISIARICESYQKVIHSLDEMDMQATREVGAVV